ncbi:SH3 domain-containing YSC84-like protein 1 [Hondaea fermentalgiana]|uniref:SH3 domain-containing YSC84-like protein 1 n=1 Tax=Hondaea fermentalgiana TaxID=2315210 RepID=A0A2R5GKY4_9STRA|nr:SH3 domain-containing YSC84-like protein 1 [Hondaea fermentalgiana]|eukprot:GBG28534.1 SH3 domain-containing YSC84-like protein 1 [Hondaea fermentalgiana]
MERNAAKNAAKNDAKNAVKNAGTQVARWGPATRFKCGFKWLGWEERFGLARCVHELHEELARQRDGIPDDVLAQCKCIMSVRVFKTGIGVLSQGIGYGCLVMRVLPDLGDGQDTNDQDDDHKAESVVNGSSSHPKSKWSPPVAIKLIGISAGVALGFRKSHLLIISNTDVLGRDLMTGARFSLGADLSIVRGPQRGDLTPRQALELNFKPVAFTYDRSGGAYLGIGLQGSVIVNRPEENRIYYEDQNDSGGVRRVAARCLDGNVSRRLPGDKMDEEDARSVATSRSTQSRQTLKSSKSVTKGKTKSKPKAKTGAVDAEATVLAYMAAQCRPYNSTKVFENLLKTISHPTIKTTLTTLVSRGALQEKVEGRAALFWITQEDHDESADDREATCKALQMRIAEAETLLLEERGTLATELACKSQLESEPADDVLNEEIEAAQADLVEAQAEVAKLRAASAAATSGTADAGEERSLQDLRQERKFWEISTRDLKRNVLSFVDQISDGMGQPPQQLIEEAGIVTDAMSARMVSKSLA